MKHILSLLLLLAVTLSAGAQSKYISSTRLSEENDRECEIIGKGGILLVSNISNLVASVSNAASYDFVPKGINSAGKYEYEVIVDRKVQTTPKVYVSKRGDINFTSITEEVSSGWLKAYSVEEVSTPIECIDQTSGNDAITDKTLAAVEITSTLQNLRTDCSPLLGAKVETARKSSDQSILVTTIIFPIQKVKDARAQVEKIKADIDALDAKAKKTDADYDRLDAMEAELETAIDNYRKIGYIEVYADETNHLHIDVSAMEPCQKKRYGILLLNKTKYRDRSKCVGFMDEGGREFALRQYENAKNAFRNALKADDTPADMLPVIKASLAQCDTCLTYERLAVLAVKKMMELREGEDATQAKVDEYANAAVDFMKVANKYNPCEYYTARIAKLEKFVASMPLDIRFKVSRWIVGRVGAEEVGPLTNVEIWGYYGSDELPINTYSSDKKFAKLISEHGDQFRQLGATDNTGVQDLHLKRDELPVGIFFRPVQDSAIRIMYKDMVDIMNQSVGDYKMRRFSVKMYARDKK